jgi:glycosyltransferase involved in cell wall biosynthesis
MINAVMIVKNEEEIIEKCLDHLLGVASSILVVDTGSTDRTEEVVRSWYYKNHSPTQLGFLESVPFKDFVTTKNEALKIAEELFPSDSYILWMDADEVLYEGGNNLVTWAEKGEVEAITGLITEGPDDYAIVGQQYQRTRMWKNNGKWKFHGPGVHEVIVGDKMPVTDLTVKVRHEHLKSDKGATAHERFGKYVELLTAHIKDNPDDHRAWFYLGRTYKDLSEFQKAISAFAKYLALPENHFKDERYQACLDMCQCYVMLGEYTIALEKALGCIKEDPGRAEIYNLLGGVHFNLQDFDSSAHFYEVALSKGGGGIPPVSLFLNPREYEEIPRDQLVQAYYRGGKFDKAEEQCAYQIRTIHPPDQRILDNMKWIRLKTQMTIFMCLGDTPEPVYGGMIDKVGVGGVETTYVMLSEAFHKMGHNVFLFCKCTEEHSHNGVIYVPWDKLFEYTCYNPSVVITSRWFDILPQFNIKKVIWVQDAYFSMPDPATWGTASNYVCSSQWHKEYIAERFGLGLSQKKLSIIPLGIKKSQFNWVPKVPGRAIYSSNPDRGLYILLEMWPKLMEKIPGLHLVVTYGWEGLATWNGDTAWQDGIVQQKAYVTGKAEEFGNIELTGRLTKERLYGEMGQAEICLYPNNFFETFCLTGLESQASGVPMITSCMGAMRTTLYPGCNVLIEGSPYSEAYQEEFISQADLLMNNKGWLTSCQTACREYIAKTPCDWDDIAKIWQERILWVEG